MKPAWPIELAVDDGMRLPPPWDRDIDISDKSVEQAFLAIHAQQPELALRICRKVFRRAQDQGDAQVAIHALHLAAVTLYNTAQDELGDRVFNLVRQHAHLVTDPHLLLRIELNFSRQLMQLGQHAQAIIVGRRALVASQALGDSKLTCFALLTLVATMVRVGNADLALDLLQQLEYMLPDSEYKEDWRSNLSNRAAIAWVTIARTQRLAGEDAAAQSALRQAQTHALVAVETANKDSDAFAAFETHVQALLLSGRADEARERADRFVAGLPSWPPRGSVSWCELQLALARVELHTGTVSVTTLENLQTIERLHALKFGHGGTPLRQTLMEAHECLGQYEQALACHVRETQSHPRQRLPDMRHSLQLLRHTVMSMRAEAVEFITHDLLTPLAAAQTWLQAAQVPSMFAAQSSLSRATALSNQYLGLLRAELMPRDDFQVLDLGALADDVCESMPTANPSGSRLTRDIAVGSEVWGDATLLTKAISALLTDAFSRAPAGTPVDLRLVRDTVAGHALLSIHCRGPRPAGAVLTRLRQQFIDGNVVGAGDLDLALAAKVARLHRARLRFEDAPGQGSKVCLTMKLRGRLEPGYERTFSGR